jgi:hypothetical protein
LENLVLAFSSDGDFFDAGCGEKDIDDYVSKNKLTPENGGSQSYLSKA